MTWIRYLRREELGPEGQRLRDSIVDETDVGWGEAPEPDDEERLRRDRPPHWDQ